MKHSVRLSRSPTGKLFSSFSRHLYSLVYIMLTLKLLPRLWRIMTVICVCAILKSYQINKRGLIIIKKCLVGKDFFMLFYCCIFFNCFCTRMLSEEKLLFFFIMEIKWMGKSDGDGIERWNFGSNFY